MLTLTWVMLRDKTTDISGPPHVDTPAFAWAKVPQVTFGFWTADTEKIGYGGGIVVFGVMLAVVAALYFWTRISRTLLFWSAFILTRPLGAVFGDFLDKPRNDGGLAFSRYAASAILVACMALCIWILPQRASERAH